MADTHYDGVKPADPNVRVDHGGWISGPSDSSAALELERAAAKARDLLSTLDDVVAQKGCPYALDRVEQVLMTLVVAAEAML